jgi:hypothetical protein
MTAWLAQVRRALWRRRHNYQVTFRSPPGQAVLRDLARFCRAHKSTFHEDPRAHAMLEGRREVWLRIESHLHLSQDELWDLHSGGATVEDEA